MPESVLQQVAAARDRVAELPRAQGVDRLVPVGVRADLDAAAVEVDDLRPGEHRAAERRREPVALAADVGGRHEHRHRPTALDEDRRDVEEIGEAVVERDHDRALGK